MKRYGKILGAAAFLALLCVFSGEAKQAGEQALSVWAGSLVPSLLPFLMVVGALTSEEACEVYRRGVGRMMPRLGLAPEMTAPAAVSLLSGSPAGAAALYRLCGVREMDRNQLFRCACFSAGASPAFLLSAVADGMLGRPEAAWLLVRAQWLSQFACLAVMRRMRPLQGAASVSPGLAQREDAVRQAVGNMLVIGGYMVFFSVLARVLSQALSPVLSGAETPLLALLELAGGCGALAKSDLPPQLKIPLVSACACFGGLSSCMQAMAFLRPLGIPAGLYLAAKGIQACFCALFAAAQLPFLGKRAVFLPDAGVMCAGAALALAALLLIGMRRTGGIRAEPDA